MAHPLQPHGPKDPSVYWRRRALVLLGALLVLFVAWRTIAGGNDSPTAKSQTPETTVTTPAVDPTQGVTPQSSDSATPEVSVTPSAPAVPPVQVPTCADSDLKVSLAITSDTVAAGVGQHMTMHVVNISTAPCKRNLGSGPNEIWITSGPALNWSTDHCYPSQASQIITLKPKQDWSVSTTWDGHRSVKGCQDLGVATQGAYWAHSRSGTAQSTDVRFVIQ